MLDLLVIFDCDGVLVDSEPIAARHTAISLSELGWEMSAADAKREFLGDTHESIMRRIEQRIGRPVPNAWATRSQARFFEALERELQPVPGVRHAIERLVSAGATLAVGSQSTHDKMRHTLGITGLLPFFEGRIFSASQVAHPKPAPDLFLLACETLGFTPAKTVVVEDSTPRRHRRARRRHARPRLHRLGRSRRHGSGRRGNRRRSGGSAADLGRDVERVVSEVKLELTPNHRPLTTISNPTACASAAAASLAA